MPRKTISWQVGFFILMIGTLPSSLVFGDWIKPTNQPPVPDVDKNEPIEAIDCWMITAANMLAAAGYGGGSDDQESAEIIYEQLKTKYHPPSG